MRLAKENGVGLDGTKGTVQLNQHIEAEKKGGRGGAAGEGQGLLEEDELRIVDDGDDVNSRRSLSSVQLPETHRLPQSQTQTQTQTQTQGRVCWERFLPVGSPKVLLVESDDSTRHVVTALLRNCSYEVIAVSNGVEAWKILEDLNNQIDLVLTEVVTSGISGIGLLSKTMSHKSCQNIPVIMMSTHDSMGIVLKCLSKGAADYLVKPIRKNELKNLWQHVWRRCHSSSGSGSESCVRNEHCTGTKCAEDSDNGTESDNEYDNRSIGLQGQDGSDNGSGTQSSWTKRAAEVESPQPPSAREQATGPPDSTCAQVIYPMPEAFASSWMPGVPQERDEQDDQLDNVPMGKDLEIGMHKNTDSRLNAPNRKNTAEKNISSLIDLNLKNDGQNFDEENVEMNIDHPKDEWIKQAMDLPREVACNDEPHGGNVSSDVPPILSDAFAFKSKDKVQHNVEDLPSLELSLKRLGDDPNNLRHSQVSAFTRYNTSSTGNQGQTGYVGSCSPPNNSSDGAKQSNSDPPNQISNSSSNNNNMGSTTNKSSTKPALATDKAPGKSTVNCSDHSSVFQPVQNHKASVGQLNAGKLHDTENHQFKIQHHHTHHHHHHHHHNVHSVQQFQKLPAQDEISKSMDRNGTETLQCGSSNNCRVPPLANVANFSLNGSASGSHNGSNFINGSTAVVNAEGTNMINDNGEAGKIGGVENGSGSGSGSGVDQNRSAQREAALTKFRLKRKERCFDKRVRYQSRKNLADQRPRVRGQFIRQVRQNKGKNADS